MAGHSVSVIISSFNQPNALRLALAGFAAQDHRDFELIVADDGSDPDTAEIVKQFTKCAPLEVEFITQEHRGGRKPYILNLGAVNSRGQQLIFTDGDCVPFRNFVSTHMAHYRPHGFCTGGNTHFALEESRALTPEDIVNGLHEKSLTPRRRRELYWIHVKNRAYQLLRRRDEPKIVGRNFSVDRGAFLEVNGFDETYNGLRKSDSEVRNRLRNAGCTGTSLWNCAFVCHVDHMLDPRQYIDSRRRPSASPELYRGSLKRIRALRGIDLLLPRR
jgi:glycosyltransferase involved in cell wall biosynthesis